MTISPKERRRRRCGPSRGWRGSGRPERSGGAGRSRRRRRPRRGRTRRRGTSDSRRSTLDRKEARVAVARAIDRREAAKVAGAKPADRLVPPGFPGYPDVAAPGFDKAAAMEALLKATDFDLSKFPRVELLTNESTK